MERSQQSRAVESLKTREKIEGARGKREDDGI
jgi:hypothetical protein